MPKMKTEPGMQVRVAGGIKPQTNRYYAKVAALYRAAAAVTGVVLVLFCMLVLAVGNEYITYDNLTYLARDFDLTIRNEGETASVISYPRHEYFRRILCNLIGEWVENGEYPDDIDALADIVMDICYNNTKKFFGF